MGKYMLVKLVDLQTQWFRIVHAKTAEDAIRDNVKGDGEAYAYDGPLPSVYGWDPAPLEVALFIFENRPVAIGILEAAP